MATPVSPRGDGPRSRRCRDRRRLRSGSRGAPRGPSGRHGHRRRSGARHVARGAAAHRAALPCVTPKAQPRRCRPPTIPRRWSGRSPPCTTGPISTPPSARCAASFARAGASSLSNGRRHRERTARRATVGPTRRRRVSRICAGGRFRGRARRTVRERSPTHCGRDRNRAVARGCAASSRFGVAPVVLNANQSTSRERASLEYRTACYLTPPTAPSARPHTRASLAMESP